MVGALALVLFAANWAANPSNWYWIAPPQAAAGAGDAGGEPPDFSIREDGPLRPGAIRVAALAPPTSEGDGAAEDAENLDGRLPAALTAAAEDRKLRFTRAELVAIAAILERFETTPLAVPADEAPASFPNLMRDPDYYRGRPARIVGEARGISDLGEGRGVELWVFLPDAGDNPVRVWANRAEGLPRDAFLETPVPVSLEGTLFKLQGYAAQGENGEGRLHVAPLILADAAKPARIAPAVPQTPASLPWIVLGVIAAVLAGGALLVWRWKAADRNYERTTLSRLSAAADGRDQPLHFATDADDPGAFLAGLSDGSAPTDPTAAVTSEPTAEAR
ncbi:hypothetical protein CA12_17170 [Alienimonas californiensis]|uniref:SURF1-like protein n=2 Tax=Alienimonas californiensis TaxID=2527989 RepID=A0A517P8D4_9PLAN|nr:hypothetical protein CA12_17170 [Alienimonas californiensis]